MTTSEDIGTHLRHAHGLFEAGDKRDSAAAQLRGLLPGCVMPIMLRHAQRIEVASGVAA